MRAATFFSTLVLLTLASGPSIAQQPAAGQAQQPTPEQAQTLSNQEQARDGRRNQKFEHLVVEDAGSRVDEVRVGGQTKSISVKPKTGTDMPQYEVQPINGERRGGPSSSGAADSTTAPRVWTLRKF